MKARALPDGTWEFEDVSINQLRELMRGVSNGRINPESTVKIKTRKKRGRPRGHVTVEELTPVQLQTWQYLTAHDTEEGIHYGDFAKAADLAGPSANDRLKRLVAFGLAYQVRPGRYRAGTGQT